MGDYNIGLRMKYEQQCPDCGQSDFVEDHASGDLVCRVGAVRLGGGWVRLGGEPSGGCYCSAQAARELASWVLAKLQVAGRAVTDGWLLLKRNTPLLPTLRRDSLPAPLPLPCPAELRCGGGGSRHRRALRVAHLC